MPSAVLYMQNEDMNDCMIWLLLNMHLLTTMPTQGSSFRWSSPLMMLACWPQPLRLFIGKPAWTPHNRPQDDHEYLIQFAHQQQPVAAH